MNYYEHHIGDYIKATAHLSMLEDSAYRRLIDAYYTREAPLPADKKACQRLARAMSKPERDAVNTVLDEFFTLGDDGWHQSRCDEEIAKYAEKKPAAEEKRENDKERQRKARERRKQLFDELSSHGVNMPFNATTEELVTELSRVTSRDASQHVTQPVTRDNTCTHTPDPNPQTPEVNPKGEQAASTPQPVPRDESPPAAAIDPITTRAIELSALLTRRGAALQASNPTVRGWAERGITDAQALTALEIAEQRRSDQANPQAINAGFLNAILGDVIAPKARASPPARNTREARISNYAAEAARARGEHENEHGTGRTERDITGESVRLA